METKRINISIVKARTIGVVLCLIFTVLCIALIALQYQSYSNKVERLKDQTSRLAELEKETADSQALLERYRDERQHLAKILFTEKDIAEFLNKISDFARNSDIRIINMEAQKMRMVTPLKDKDLDTSFPAAGRPFSGKNEKKQESGPSLVFMPIDLTIEGRFERLIEFLISLEKYRQLLTLSNVSIRRAQAYPLLNCKFVLRLYALKQMEEFVK